VDTAQATISGGMSNRIQTSATSAAIGGGSSNAVGPGAVSATIGGGEANIAGAVYATVSGGQLNANGGMYATITGGIRNTNNGIAASVGGGSENSATGGAATVPGGDHNSAGADYSFAAGHRAKATHTGSFVWADSLEFNYGSIANNEFSVRATGGARIVSGLDGGGNPSAGVSLAAGSGSWSSISDRHAKTNVAPVDARGVLDRLARLPLATWSYKTQDPRIRHIGPMAQDFAGAFQVGEDDTHIATVDANGVALAAIQGLNQKLEEQIEQKQAKVSALEQRLAELEKLVDALTRNQGGAR